jgi:integrase
MSSPVELVPKTKETKGATGTMRPERREIATKDSDAVNWIKEKSADGARPNTLRAYHQAMAKLGNLTPKPLAELTREEYVDLLDRLNGSKSARWYASVLRLYLSWKERDVTKWARGKRSENAETRWKDPEALLSRDDVAKMVAGETDLRNRALLALLWDTGRRIHEVLALDISDLSDRDGLSVRFRKAKVAKEAGTRVKLIESRDAISKWLAVHPLLKKGGPLFTTTYEGERRRMAYSAALHIVKQAAARVGISKTVAPHLLRHSRATDLRLLGVSDAAIRLRLGWSRDSTMINRYVSLADSQADDEVATKLGLKSEKRPASVRKLELGAEIPALGDEVDALKAKIAEMERDREKFAVEAVRAEVEKMAASFRTMLKDGGFEVRDRELTAEEARDKKAIGVWVSTKKT